MLQFTFGILGFLSLKLDATKDPDDSRELAIRAELGRKGSLGTNKTYNCLSLSFIQDLKYQIYQGCSSYKAAISPQISGHLAKIN